MSAWSYLVIAGLLEVGFTTFLKLSNGFSLDRWPYIGGFVAFGALSFYMLSLAMKTVPLGTAYAVWTGIGAAGTAIVGMLFFKDPVGWLRIVLLVILVGSVAGLKVASPK